jgi:hypothetical protein
MKRILIILFLLSIATVAICQDTAPSSSFAPGSAYLYSGTLQEADQLKIKTYIWGQVRKPGLYIVPDDTDLLTLLSLANGPTEDAKLSKIRIVRSTEEGEEIILVDLKDYMETANDNLIPTLQPGDTIIVSGTVFYAFTRWADFLSNIAIFLSMYLTISNL